MNSLAQETSRTRTPFNALFPDFDIMSTKGYLDAVRYGVSGHTLRSVIKVIGERELIARAIGKDASNLSKSYQLKRLSSIAADNLIDTLRVYIQAAEIYDSLELAKEWMNSPIPALGGEIPASLLDTHAGREMVRQTLRKLQFGEYV